MSQTLIHKHSADIIESGIPKVPNINQIHYGEIAVNYADGVETIIIKNSNNKIVEFKPKDYVDGLAKNYDAAGTAAQALLDAKAYADGLAENYDVAGAAVNAAASALTDAKAYADGLAVNYDAAGAAVNAAASAKTEAIAGAKEYTDTEIGKLGNVYAPKESIETLVGEDTNKTVRAIAAEEVAKVVAGADESFDTLKEIADWIANDTTGAASMADDIANLKAISADTRLDALESDTHKHENKAVLDGITAEKVAAWDGAEQNAKAYADGLAENYDVAGAAASALTDAKAYADGLAENYDVAGAAASALTDAKNFTTGEIANLSEVYDAKGAAAQALLDAKAYADGLAVNYDAAGAAASALTDAKAYADGLAENYDVAGAAASALTDAKAYADGLAENYDVAGAAADALGDAKEYTDTEIDKLGNVYAKKDTVDTLVGEDTNKTVRIIAAEEVVKIVSGAPESYDTLKEIADWILNDTTGAAAMANDINELKAISADTRLDSLEIISGQSHTHSNKSVLDGITSTKVSNWDSAATNKHTHSNKALLDTYTQTEEDLADAVSKKHAHENKEVLDGITAEKVNAWDTAEQNAKDYANTIASAVSDSNEVIAHAISAIKESIGLNESGEFVWNNVTTSIKNVLTLISAVTKSYPTTYIWEWDETDTGSITAEDYDAMAAATIFILNPLGAIATSKLNLGGNLMITFTIPFITDGTINMNLVVNRQNLTYQMITEQVVIPTSISQLSNDRNYITSEDLNGIIDAAITSKLNTEI